MKKKILVSIVLGVLVLTAVLLPGYIYKRSLGNNDEIINVVYSEKVFALNDSGKLIGQVVALSQEDASKLTMSDEIRQKWELLTTHQELLPDGYSSVLSNKADLVDYEIAENVLSINTTSDITTSLGRKAAEAIVWTFCEHDIKEVVLKVNDEVINNFNDFTFKKLTKDIGINFTYETMFLHEATATTIVKTTETQTIATTYFHLNSDVCDYIVSKILETSSVSDLYDYELGVDYLNMTFNDKSVLPSSIIDDLSASVMLNFDINRFSLNDLETVLYEIDITPQE